MAIKVFVFIFLFLGIRSWSLEQVYITASGGTAIYEKKDVSSKVIGKAPYDAKIDLEEFSREWVKVNVDGVVGYIKRGSVEYVKRKKAIVTASTMPKIYEERREGAYVITLAQKGAQYDVLKIGTQWVQMMTPQGPGWIEKKHVYIGNSSSVGVKYYMPFLLFMVLFVGVGIVLWFWLRSKKGRPDNGV